MVVDRSGYQHEGFGRFWGVLEATDFFFCFFQKYAGGLQTVNRPGRHMCRPECPPPTLPYLTPPSEIKPRILFSTHLRSFLRKTRIFRVSAQSNTASSHQDTMDDLRRVPMHGAEDVVHEDVTESCQTDVPANARIKGYLLERVPEFVALCAIREKARTRSSSQ